jgi:uncharacterized membrane protein
VNAWPVALLALAFPLLAHAAALTGSQAFALASVGALVLAVAWPLRTRMVAFASIVVVAVGALALLGLSGKARVAMLLPPILITFAIAWQFASSLSPGRTPLIQRIVVALHPEAMQLPGVPAYTRRVTLLWAVLLGSLCVINTVLALLAVPDGFLHALGAEPFVRVPLRAWSLFANVLNYVVILGFFMGEYVYRRTRFPDQPYRNFGDFLARVARLGPAFWRGR